MIVDFSPGADWPSDLLVFGMEIGDAKLIERALTSFKDGMTAAGRAHRQLLLAQLSERITEAETSARRDGAPAEALV